MKKVPSRMRLETHTSLNNLSSGMLFNSLKQWRRLLGLAGPGQNYAGSQYRVATAVLGSEVALLLYLSRIKYGEGLGFPYVIVTLYCFAIYYGWKIEPMPVMARWIACIGAIAAVFLLWRNGVRNPVRLYTDYWLASSSTPIGATPNSGFFRVQSGGYGERRCHIDDLLWVYLTNASDDDVNFRSVQADILDSTGDWKQVKLADISADKLYFAADLRDASEIMLPDIKPSLRTPLMKHGRKEGFLVFQRDTELRFPLRELRIRLTDDRGIVYESHTQVSKPGEDTPTSLNPATIHTGNAHQDISSYPSGCY